MVISEDSDFIAVDYPTRSASNLYVYEKKPCHTSCATCSGPNSNQCNSCPCGQTLQGTAPNYSCVGLLCNGCSGTFYQYPSNCTSCFPADPFPTYLDVAQAKCTYCYPASNPGYYPNSITGICTACPVGCATCTSATVCTSCITSYFKDPTSMCVTCTVGPYFQSGSLCLKCDSNCATCLVNSTNCLSCPIPNKYVILETGICADCNINDHHYTEGGYCKPCGSTCLTCVNSSYCTKCITDFGINSATNLCVPCTSTGVYPDGDFCRQCPTDCSTCTSATVCTACQNNKRFMPGSSLCGPCNVGVGFYENGTHCFACGSGCKVCTSPTNCQTCNSGVYMRNNSQCGACDTANKEYISGGNCLSCLASCQTCTSSTSCASCPTNFGLNSNNECVACDDGKYINAAGTCVACSPVCVTCSQSSSRCTSCDANQGLSLNLLPYTCAPCTAASLFVDSNNICRQCDGNCKTCSGSSTKCTSCPTTLSLSLATNSCVVCASGSYVDANNICRACHSSCLTCSTEPACLTCADTSHTKYEGDGTCMYCGEGFFVDTDLCRSCSTNCATCFGTATSCTSCARGMGLEQSSNLCVSDCGVGRYAGLNGTINTCQACNGGCSQCSGSATHCTACDTTKGLYLSEGNATCGPCNSSAFEIKGTLCVAKSTAIPVVIVMNTSSSKADGVDEALVVTITSPSLNSSTVAIRILKSVSPNTTFTRVEGGVREIPKSKVEMSTPGPQGYLTLTLIDYLETDKYKLVFRSDVSTFVEFEDTVYEILPYNFTFDFDNPRSSKQQIAGAQNQGQAIGGLIAGLPVSSPVGMDIITLAVSSDPTGILTKASQIVKLYNRAFYFKINYGDRFGAFMESIEKFSSTKRASGNSYIKTVGSSGWRGRLSEKRVSGDFLGDFVWKIPLYISIWILRATLSLLIAYQVRFSKGVLVGLYFISKVKLIVFNMVLLDFGFYATHAAMHFNYFPSSQLAMLCLTLIVLDILEMVDIVQSSSAWLYYYKTVVVAKNLAVLPQSPDSNESSSSKKDLRKTDTLSNIILDSSNNNGSTASPVAPPRMVIDYPKTYANINARVHLVEFMAAPLKDTKYALESKAARVLLCAHTIRMLAYNVIIGCTQYAAGLGIGTLLILELVRLYWTIRLGTNKIFRTWLTFIVELNQSLFSIAFLCVAIILHPKMMSQSIGPDIQNVGIFIVLTSVVTEYLLLLITIIFQLVVALRSKKQQPKNSQNKPHWSHQFVGFIVYVPGVYYSSGEPAKKAVETSLNTPDNSNRYFAKSFPSKVSLVDISSKDKATNQLTKVHRHKFTPKRITVDPSNGDKTMKNSTSSLGGSKTHVAQVVTNPAPNGKADNAGGKEAISIPNPAKHRIQDASPQHQNISPQLLSKSKNNLELAESSKSKKYKTKGPKSLPKNPLVPNELGFNSKNFAASQDHNRSPFQLYI